MQKFLQELELTNCRLGTGLMDSIHRSYASLYNMRHPVMSLIFVVLLVVAAMGGIAVLIGFSHLAIQAMLAAVLPAYKGLIGEDHRTVDHISFALALAFLLSALAAVSRLSEAARRRRVLACLAVHSDGLSLSEIKDHTHLDQAACEGLLESARRKDLVVLDGDRYRRL